jgi:hypothetical protein
MKRSDWAAFHDATIEAIDGAVPGDVRLTIECQYLRQRFGGQGTRFVLTLKGCTLFAFTPYVGEPCVTLADIQEHQPEILYVEQRADLVLLCTTGEITLSYDSARLALDNGQAITSEDLLQAARSYWQEWDSQRR